MQHEPTTPEQPKDQNTEAAKFKADEKHADKAWEKEKDIVSGVNKTIEKKLGEGDLKPGDIENLGD